MLIIHDALIIVHRENFKSNWFTYISTLQKDSNLFKDRDAQEISQHLEHLELFIVQDAHIF